LALAAYPDQDPRCVQQAFQAGINFFFFYSAGQKHFVDGLRPLVRTSRDQIILASGSGARTGGGLRAARKAILSAIGAETIDIFFAEYINPDDDVEAIFGSGGVLDELQKWKANGSIRFVGASAHDRKLAKRLAHDARVDVLMVRYNMAHRKVAHEVFPAAIEAQTPIVAFTATRWATLLAPQSQWPGQPPTAADCYRYCLTDAAVTHVLSAPKTIAELEENLSTLHLPPMNGETRRYWEKFGDIVYNNGGLAADPFEMRWP
jgi:aryl-alcohol dehydrogenase-like predicted oxidoreductase